MVTASHLNIAYDELSLAERFSLLGDDEQSAYLQRLYEQDEIDTFLKNWDFWGRPEQQMPEGDDWDILFWCAGRGSGKTRTASEIVQKWAENRGWYIPIVGETAAEVRDVMIEGPSGLIATAKPWNPIVYEPSKRRVSWPKTGAWGTTFSGDKPDQLRGPSGHAAWIDEIAKFRNPDLTWDNLEMVLRAGRHPQVVISSTPRPIPLIRRLIEESKAPGSRVTLRTSSTYRNVANLAPTFIRRMLDRYEGTRLGRQELHAELLSDTPGALWTQALIEQNRVQKYPDLVRIVVGVDPAGGTVTETGIVVAGLGKDGHGYILDDVSLAGTPGAWGSAVVLAYDKYRGDRIAAEVNNGGEMVISTVETAARDQGIRVATKKLHASRGKVTRAEPVAALYEQGRIHHVGMFAQCEDELTTWVPDEGLPSPNRLDALVWAVTELMLGKKNAPIILPGGNSQKSRW